MPLVHFSVAYSQLLSLRLHGYKHRGKTIMMDAGIHPGFSGEASLPFLDTVDLDTVDVLLVTHFHLDHCAAVPYVVGRTNFKVRYP